MMWVIGIFVAVGSFIAGNWIDKWI
jgi:hypothetical protein